MKRKTAKKARYVWMPSKEVFESVRKLAEEENLSINQVVCKAVDGLLDRSKKEKSYEGFGSDNNNVRRF